MDIVRLAILIWLFLPIPGYWLARHWYFAQIRKHPSVTSARIVKILSDRTTLIDNERGLFEALFTDVICEFSVQGTEYRVQATLPGKISEPGGDIRVRYDPERPYLWCLDDLREKARGWVALCILVFSFDLGILFVAISFGLFLLIAATRLALRREPALAHYTPVRTTLISLTCVFVGLPLVALGINGLVVNGFWDQIILWALWNL